MRLASSTVCSRIRLTLPLRRSRIQVLLCSASATVLFFFLVVLYRAGKQAERGASPSQAQPQKDVVRPSPMMTFVADAKSSLSTLSQGGTKADHGRHGCCHASQ